MVAQTVTLRIPDAWESRLDSAMVRAWVAAFLQRPTRDLPADPGGGEARITLSLPKRAVKVISGLLDETESAALRRIIAANVGALPPGRPRRVLPAFGRPEGGLGRVAALPSGSFVEANPKLKGSPSNARFSFDLRASIQVLPPGFMPAGMPATPELVGSVPAAMPDGSAGGSVPAVVPGLGWAYIETAFWVSLGVLSIWLLIRFFRASKPSPVALARELARFAVWVPKAM